jgi:hypothetical protein
VADASGVFWGLRSAAHSDIGSWYGGSLLALPTGGTRTQVDGDGAPVSIAIRNGTLYWTRQGTEACPYGHGCTSQPNLVMSIPVGGTTATTLYETTASLGSIAVDATNVYFVSGSDIMKLPIAGGTPSVLASASEAPADIALDATTASVYWTEPTAGTVMGVPIAGGSPKTICSPLGGPDDIVARSGVLYWTNSNDGTIRDGTIRKLNLLGIEPDGRD